MLEENSILEEYLREENIDYKLLSPKEIFLQSTKETNNLFVVF
jgi:hypothetical protein